MCKNCLVSLVATYFVIYFLIVAIMKPALSIWLYSLIITVLLYVAIMSCPILNKDGWNCCQPAKPVKKGKKK